MTTRVAFLASTRAVMCLIPYFTVFGFAGGAALSPWALAWATAKSLAFLACLVSGLWLSKSLKRAWAVVLSTVLVNWLTAGGTFNLFWRTRFCLWRRMYFGHLTNRVTSRRGGRSLPMLKFRGFFSKRLDLTGSCFPLSPGWAGFLTTTFFLAACWVPFPFGGY